MISDFEFTNDIDGFPSADVMYHNYLKYYDKKTCVKCSKEWWQKKTMPIQTDLCVECRKESIKLMNLENI
jgi:hypothetical protein